METRIEAVWQEALSDATDLAVSDAAFAAEAAASPEVQAIVEYSPEARGQSSGLLEDFKRAVAREYGSIEYADLPSVLTTTTAYRYER